MSAVHVSDSLGEILLDAARDLARVERELLAPPRELHVVEFRGPDGQWRPMAGDAYPDAFDAERCSKRSKLQTRVVVYRPVSP